MSVNQVIEKGLAAVTTEIWPNSCPEEIKPDKYIVYKVNEEAVLYADDRDEEWGLFIDIHYFSKGNYISAKNKIRNILRESGFIVTDIETLYENDTGYHHVIISCNLEESEE